MEKISYQQFQEEVEKSGTLVLSWQDCDKNWMVVYEIERNGKTNWIRTCLSTDEKDIGGYRCFVENISTLEELKETLEWINDKWNWEKMKPYWELYSDEKDYFDLLIEN